MARMIDAILIDPFALTVTAVKVDGDDYTAIYPLISHPTMPVNCFCTAHASWLRGRDAVFVDDEGLQKDCRRFFVLDGVRNPLAGKGLILGADDDGESTSAATPLADVARHVRFAFAL